MIRHHTFVLPFSDIEKENTFSALSSSTNILKNGSATSYRRQRKFPQMVAQKVAQIQECATYCATIFWLINGVKSSSIVKGSAVAQVAHFFDTYIRKKKYTRENLCVYIFFSIGDLFFCATALPIYILVYKWRYDAKNLVAQQVAQVAHSAKRQRTLCSPFSPLVTKSGVRRNLFRFEMFGLFAVEGSASNSVTTSVYFAKFLLNERIWSFSFFCGGISRSEKAFSN